MTRTERLLRLAKLRGDRAAELILSRSPWHCGLCQATRGRHCVDDAPRWTEAELRAAWGDR